LRALVVDADGGREGLSGVVSALHLGWTDVHVHQVHARELRPGVVEALAPDLVVVCAAEPGLTWLEHIRAIRQGTSAVIAAVVSDSNESSLIEAVDAGADLFLSLPISLPAFVARTRATLRRARPSVDTPSAVTCGDLVVDPESYEVRLHGQLLQVTPTEFQILYCLAKRGGRVSPKALLCSGIWNDERVLDDTTLRKHIQQLRRKFAAVPHANASIVTIPSVGHKLVPKPADGSALMAV